MTRTACTPIAESRSGLENDQLSLSFDRTTGALLDFTNKIDGLALANRPAWANRSTCLCPRPIAPTIPSSARGTWHFDREVS